MNLVLPDSSFLTDETRAAMEYARVLEKEQAAAFEGCIPEEKADLADVPKVRAQFAEIFYTTRPYKILRERYPVAMNPEVIGGVYTEIFTPLAGIEQINEERVLINVHGGGFEGGVRYISHLESVPIACVGKIKVVSIDYRMAPEYTFPAATEDVAAVYRELLKSYSPGNIGIFGCSAGGVLTSQAVAWFQREGLPLPGAVGMFCGAGSFWAEGDSGHIGAALAGTSFTMADEHPYFKGQDPNDPLVFPARSAKVMAAFPPSLLVAATRDLALSSVVHTHRALVHEGVEADLQLWEGLGHAFFFDPGLPESREFYDIAVKFFDKHLGP